MSESPLISKIAAPYAKGLFQYVQKCDNEAKVTTDFTKLEDAFRKTKNLMLFLKNPLVLPEDKKNVLLKIVTRRAQKETLRFFDYILQRNRIHVLNSIVFQYLQLVYTRGTIRRVEVAAPFQLTRYHEHKLVDKLSEIMNVEQVKLCVIVDSTLIGGIMLKTYTKRVDFSVKKKLQKLSKLLDTDLDI